MGILVPTNMPCTALHSLSHRYIVGNPLTSVQWKFPQIVSSMFLRSIIMFCATSQPFQKKKIKKKDLKDFYSPQRALNLVAKLIQDLN